jgi:hypothetical protein
MLSYGRAGAWNDVLALQRMMRESRVKANQTFNGPQRSNAIAASFAADSHDITQLDAAMDARVNAFSASEKVRNNPKFSKRLATQMRRRHASGGRDFPCYLKPTPTAQRRKATGLDA